MSPNLSPKVAQTTKLAPPACDGPGLPICKKPITPLCGDLMEEVFDESSFPLKSELDDFNCKGKSHAKSCLSKTCKIRRVKFSKKRC
jgi:hypothetical protein